MYPVFRLLKASVHALASSKISFDTISEITMRCHPWDLDFFMEMNNGRILTLYDLGRMDLAIRSGIQQRLKQHKWGMVVAGSTVRYRKRIRIFDRITMRTQLMGFDQRWIYISQSMWVHGQAASSVLLRTGITAQGKTIPTKEVLAALQLESWQPKPDPWLQSWIQSEAQRPWPPEQTSP